MALDYRQVQEQVRQLGEHASASQSSLANKREDAFQLLAQYANNQVALREKVHRVATSYDRNLRCANPPDPSVRPLEALNAAFDPPALPEEATILTADGSQIPLDRHAEVLYCLINVGAIQFRLGQAQSPQIQIHSHLMYDKDFDPSGMITDARLALLRDTEERSLLAEMAQTANPPVFTFTDGPVELWGAKEGEGSEFLDQLKEYLAALRQLNRLDATVAGYVDKPTANLVVRLLEVATMDESQLKEIKTHYPLRGATDLALFRRLLKSGQRSAVFATQSQSAQQYKDELALHFFYLNVGRRNHLARVEIPAWVAADPVKLDGLHAVLVDQCRIMGSRPYPYLLHRAHETALVTLEEREQVTQMIALELRNRGIEVGEKSDKQASKELGGRKSYS
jgi:hypothetical protein